MATRTTRIFGSGIKRREDPRLITGKSRYTDDMKLPGTVYLAFVRSPHAHARIKRVDTSAAQKAPGVIAVFTGADMEINIPTAFLVPDGFRRRPRRAILRESRAAWWVTVQLLTTCRSASSIRAAISCPAPTKRRARASISAWLSLQPRLVK